MEVLRGALTSVVPGPQREACRAAFGDLEGTIKSLIDQGSSVIPLAQAVAVGDPMQTSVREPPATEAARYAYAFGLSLAADECAGDLDRARAQLVLVRLLENHCGLASPAKVATATAR